jgi:hypothetical protein
MTRKFTTRRYVYVDGRELKVGSHPGYPADFHTLKTPLGANEAQRNAANSRESSSGPQLESIFTAIEQSQE